MNKTMIKIIEKSLNLNIDDIKKSSWDDLSSRIKKNKKFAIPFRPKLYFGINGNIHMEQGRYMGTKFIDFCNSIDYLGFKIKCFLKNIKIK